MKMQRVSLRGFKTSLNMIFQMFEDLHDFLKSEEEREGEERIEEIWQSLSEEEVEEFKKILNKIRNRVDKAENYIDKNRQAFPI
jgi:Asp-tRNA(Asn)/Glu-tRNA(Gln) amidotransferase C subunit